MSKSDGAILLALGLIYVVTNIVFLVFLYGAARDDD